MCGIYRGYIHRTLYTLYMSICEGRARREKIRRSRESHGRSPSRGEEKRTKRELRRERQTERRRLERKEKKRKTEKTYRKREV